MENEESTYKYSELGMDTEAEDIVLYLKDKRLLIVILNKDRRPLDAFEKLFPIDGDLRFIVLGKHLGNMEIFAVDES